MSKNELGDTQAIFVNFLDYENTFPWRMRY